MATRKQAGKPVVGGVGENQLPTHELIYRQLRELHPGTLRIFANMLEL